MLCGVHTTNCYETYNVYFSNYTIICLLTSVMCDVLQFVTALQIDDINPGISYIYVGQLWQITCRDFSDVRVPQIQKFAIEQVIVIELNAAPGDVLYKFDLLTEQGNLICASKANILLIMQ